MSSIWTITGGSAVMSQSMQGVDCTGCLDAPEWLLTGSTIEVINGLPMADMIQR